MTGRKNYSGFGLAIASDFELTELEPSEARPDVVIRVGEVTPSGCQPALREEIFFVPDVAGFHIRDGREIIVEVFPGADRVKIRRALLGYAMAVLLRQLGWLALHASAAVVGRRAILFLGPSGSGKSTTAAAFHQSGHDVVADDLTVVREMEGQCIMCPGLAWVRLLPDAQGVLRDRDFDHHEHDGKRSFRLRKNHTSPEPMPVGCIYVLEEGTHLESIRIPPMEAVAVLRQHAQLRVRRLKKDVMNQHLASLTSVARVVPVRRLIRPRTTSVLADLVELVKRQAASGAEGD